MAAVFHPEAERMGAKTRAHPGLPEDLMMEILKRAPTVACMARFRCLNKSWNRRLSGDDPCFIRKMLLFDKDENARVMVCYSLSQPKRYSVLSSSSEAPLVASSGVLLPDLFRSPRVVGCCDGIFCLQDYYGDPDKIVLWNPTTCESKLLPSFYDHDVLPRKLLAPDGNLASQPSSHLTCYGFGFDPETDDYKVVVFAANRALGIAGVYTLRSNSWRRVHTCDPSSLRPYCWVPHQPDTRETSFSSSCCHWVAQDYSPDLQPGVQDRYLTVTSFDMSKEVFNAVRLPHPGNGNGNDYYGDCKRFVNVRMVKQSLVAAFPVRELFGEVRAILGPYNHPGVSQRSWTLLFKGTIAPTRFWPGYIFPSIWRHGSKDLVLQWDVDQWYMVDLDTGRDQLLDEDVIGPYFESCCPATTYVPSSISLT